MYHRGSARFPVRGDGGEKPFYESMHMSPVWTADTQADNMREDDGAERLLDIFDASRPITTERKIAPLKPARKPKSTSMRVFAGAFNPGTTDSLASLVGSIIASPSAMRNKKQRSAPMDDPGRDGRNERAGNHGRQFADALRTVDADGVVRSSIDDFTSDLIWNGDSVQEIIVS